MSDLIQFAFSGITIGSIYGLVAVGFCIVYNATGAINFAQGEFVMVGGMIAAVISKSWGWPLPLVFFFAVIAAVLLGFICEKMTFGLCRDPRILNLIIITIGLAIAMKGAVMMIWGKFPKDLPNFSTEKPMFIMGATLIPQAIWIVLISVAVMLFMRFFLEKTTLGTAMPRCCGRQDSSLFGGYFREMDKHSFLRDCGRDRSSCWSDHDSVNLDLL